MQSQATTWAILLSLFLLAGCASTSPGSPPTTATPAPGCTDDGLVRQERIESPTLGRPFTFAYYLPPCYEQRAPAAYPVLYLIPGGGGTPSTWTVDMHAAEAADWLIHSGQVPPFILVTMPNISDDQHGAALIDDLIPYVDAHLRTLPDRRHRGVGGASLGGLIAYRMAFQHPDMFASLGLFGGVVRPEEEAIDGWIAAMPAGQRPRVLMDYGDQDLLLTKSQVLRDVLDRWGMEYTLNVEPGDHDMFLWSGHLDMYLEWYAEDW
jgi:enterochelin esterase-like enzyme